MMRSRLMRVLTVVAALVAVPGLVSAQFGHPLKGQWSGQWGPANSSQRLLLDLHWDGKAITGSVNPGPDAAAIRRVTFDYSNPEAWKVRLEAERKDASGKAVTIVADGTLENIGSYNRLFHGTWTEGGRKGEFTVTRN
jgi:hypothetical protein